MSKTVPHIERELGDDGVVWYVVINRAGKPVLFTMDKAQAKIKLAEVW